MHVSQVLKLHKQASTTHASIEDWTFVDTGVSGSEHLERIGDNYYARITQGTLVSERGAKDGKRWLKDANGFTMLDASEDDRSFYGIRVREDAEDPKNDVSVAGETGGEHNAYVLRVKLPQTKHPEYVFYDAATGNIVRVERIQRKSRIIETYDDFRTVDGVTQAFHVHDAYEDHALDDDYKLVSFSGHASIDEQRFTAPASNESSLQAAESSVLPGQLTDEGTPIVRLTINGRGYDFELSSADNVSYIDRDVAAQLNLPSIGAKTNSKGQPIPYQAILPDAQAGPIHFHNFAFTATEIAYHPSWDTKIVGYLGYDFLSSNVFKVDYVARKIEVVPAKAFGTGLPAAEAQDIPVTFRDGNLFVPMMIGSGFTDKVLVVSNEPFTFVFGGYADDHAADFKGIMSLTGEGDGGAYVPFADEDSGALGVRFHLSISKTSTLRFANANYEDHPIMLTNARIPDTDAVLGLDYLHYFDLYFDYPHQRFIVVPNKWFHETFRTIQ